MKKIIYIVLVLMSFNAAAQKGLIINEFSQGTNGTKEFFEFVVIGQKTCTDSTLDIRGWIFDDHCGWYSGAGAAGGHKRFANDANWAKVPIGSIILVYNDVDKNTNITQAADPTDANKDYVYIVPVSSSLLDQNGDPANGGAGGSYVYPTTGYVSGGGSWTNLGLRNDGDAVISVDPAVRNKAFHSITYNDLSAGAQTPTVAVGSVVGGRNCYLSNGNYTTSSAYTVGSAGTSAETPGAANSTSNASWIAALRLATGSGTQSRDTVNESICQGQAFVFNGNSYNTAGFYTATFPLPSGCDSVVVLNLSVTQGLNISIAQNDVSCFGGTDGSAIASVTGGTSPYAYEWRTNPVQTSNIATNLSAGTYKLIVLDDNSCPDTVDVIIVEPAKLEVVSTVDKYTCSGERTGEASVVVSGGVSPYNIVWATSPTQNGSKVTQLEEGVYTVAVTDDKGCVATATVSIVPYPFSSIAITAEETEVCKGSKVQINATGLKDYQWTPPSGLSCADCPNPVVIISRNSTYSVYGIDTNGCKDTGSISFTVLEGVPVAVGSQKEICKGAAVDLEASGGKEYLWSPSTGLNNNKLANPRATPDSTTTYTVIITQNKCFKDTLYQTVVVSPPPTVELGPNIQALPSAEIQLKAETTNAVNIEWSPADDLSCAYCFDPVAKMKKTVTYKVTVTGNGTCSATDFITLTASCNGSELFMPNTFTPNGDGNNDYFYPQGKGIGTVKNFKIMNSWGQVMFQVLNIPANNPVSGWDGRFNGKEVSPDVFVYMVELQCSGDETKIVTGDITLIR